jgi:hypothetical protein
MATTLKPTHEQIAKVLDQILRELGEIKRDQQRLAADLGKPTRELGH